MCLVPRALHVAASGTERVDHVPFLPWVFMLPPLATQQVSHVPGALEGTCRRLWR